MDDENARLREALIFAKTLLTPAQVKQVGEIERGERTCVECGVKESNRWFGIRAGLPQCLKCYTKHTVQLRKARRHNYPW